MTASASGRCPRAVVFCAGTSWDGVPGSDRHLASALARYVDVLWVDPPTSALTPARYLHGATRRITPLLRTVGDGLVRLTPTAPPGLSRRAVRPATWRLVRAQIRWALRRLSVRPYAVLAASLDDVLGGWGENVLDVLYGTDDYVAGAELMGQDAARLRAEERRQLDRADVVLAVSPPLRNRWLAMGAHPILVPNGVDAAAYTGPNVRPDRTATVDGGHPAAAAGLSGPVVGLVGQLSDRIDIELLEAVADTGLALLLVGPHQPGWLADRFGALAARPNVAWVGRVPFDLLPSYLRLMSVGITPYRDTAFNRASFPLKTLEYLAAGLPAVSTDLPAVQWLRTDLVSVATGPAGFAAAVRAAVDRGSPGDLVAARRAFAATHSWDRRAETVAGVLGLPTAAPVHREAS